MMNKSDFALLCEFVLSVLVICALHCSQVHDFASLSNALTLLFIETVI